MKLTKANIFFIGNTHQICIIFEQNAAQKVWQLEDVAGWVRSPYVYTILVYSSVQKNSSAALFET